MKHRFILVMVVIALLAGFGIFLHSPPSIVDTISGVTPKAKKAAQASAQLEGSYYFCMNPGDDRLSDDSVREQLKAFVSGQTDDIRVEEELTLYLYVSETDYALVRYVDSLCERVNGAGINTKVKLYSNTMLRSRVMSGRYEVFLSDTNLVNEDKLENADFIILYSGTMR